MDLFIGESIGTVYGYVIDGIWQVEDENIPDGFAPGLYKLRDLNNDGQITPQDDRQILRAVRTSLPTWASEHTYGTKI